MFCIHRGKVKATLAQFVREGGFIFFSILSLFIVTFIRFPWFFVQSQRIVQHLADAGHQSRRLQYFQEMGFT